MATITDMSQQYINTGPSSGGSSSGNALLLAALRPWPIPVTPRPVMANPPTQTLAKGTGAAGVSVAAGGSGYVVGDIVDVQGGDPAAIARFRVSAVDANGAVTQATVQQAGIYRTAPTNPASTTGGTGTGAQFNVTWNAGVASSMYGGGNTWSRNNPAFRYWGNGIKDIVSGYYGNGVGNGTQCIVEFNSDAPKLDFRFVGANSQYDLYVDGQRISSSPTLTDSSGAPFIYTVDWGGVVAPRKYRLLGVNTAFGGVVTDTKSTIWFPDEIRPPSVWQLGDSYTFGIGATQASFNDFHVMCDALGLDGLADGIGGSGWTSTGSTQPQQRIQAKLAPLTYTPDYIFLSLGYNDAPAGRIELLKTNFTESVQLIKSICPKARLIVIGPATPLGQTAQISAVRDAMIELCATMKLTFIDVNNWVNATNKQLYTAGDNVHPNDAGHFFRGARLAQAISRYL